MTRASQMDRLSHESVRGGKRNFLHPCPLDEDGLETEAQLASHECNVPMLRTTLVFTPEGREGLALAAHLRATGELDHRLALRILGYGLRHRGANRDGAILALDSLRIAAAIAPRFPRRPGHWAQMATGAAVGALRGRQTPLATSAELDSAAAVAAFILWDEQGQHCKARWKGGEVSRRVENPELDALLRERTADLDRIIEYVADRGMPSENLAAVDELRAWLDSGTPSAVTGGWL